MSQTISILEHNNIINPISVFNKKIIQINNLYDIISRAITFKSADLYIVYLNNLYALNYNGYIMNKLELESGYCDTMFLFTSDELKSITGISMIEYIKNHSEEYFYIYNNLYIIPENYKNDESFCLNNENFLIDSKGSIIDHFKINKSDNNIAGYIQTYINIINKFIAIDYEFSRRSNEIFITPDFEENNQFISMTTGKVSDGTTKFILQNPSNNKKYIFILYKGLIQYKKNDKLIINILDVVKQSSYDQDLFYMKIDTIRKKKLVCSTYMIFINLI